METERRTVATTTMKLGPNKFKVTHEEMRSVPRILFRELPEGTIATISDASKTGFTVQFEPATIKIEKFGFELSAEH
jgi:hypothetical protein